MTSKVRVDAKICSHQTEIAVTDRGDGTMSVHIVTECKDIRHFAELVTELASEDYVARAGSKIWEAADQAGLTATCLVPTALFNACWVEAGMISKNLALKEGPICIEFLE